MTTFRSRPVIDKWDLIRSRFWGYLGHLVIFVPRRPPEPQISNVMDNFEKQFEDLDVQTSYMEAAMSQTTAQATPQDEVEELMQKVADEHGLELKMDLPGVSVGAGVEKEKETTKEEDELGARLAKLRNASS